MSKSGKNKRDNNIWMFNSGNKFDGNPKWLFIYINNHRKDITTYWICNSKETVKLIKKLGYNALEYNSKKSKELQNKTGVFVVNQVKEYIPPNLIGAKVLNLWHGVGCKSIERKLNSGILNEKVAKKYIKYNEIFMNDQLFLVTSPLMEKHFKEQCGIDDNHIIRGGYPCCIYKENIKTFSHDILKQKGLDSNTKIAIYCPTFRENSTLDFFGKAIPDIEALIRQLEKLDILLIFKMHPLMEKDYKYNALKNIYSKCKNILFWDNKNDIYEIFDIIDLAIVDYSSIFYDLFASKIPHFIRYIFDYEDKNNVRDLVFDYKEMTFGKICNNFDELLNSLSNYQEDNSEKKEIIYDLFWSYANNTSLEDIINQTLDFKQDLTRELPVLYSFDIFDTLIERNTLVPEGTFYYVQDKIQDPLVELPKYIKKNFVKIRRTAEANVREYYKKTVNIRNDNRLEITFEEIYKHIEKVYNLSKLQSDFLKQCELDCEYENCKPKDDMIEIVKSLLNKKEKVILISDMYLPKEVITKILFKANPILSKLPLYLSSEYGVRKINKKLFLKVYEELDYNYKQWIHYGDNRIADGKRPSQLGIKSVIHPISKFNTYERELVDEIQTYDSYLVAAMMSRFRQGFDEESSYYSYAYVSLYLIPYVSWVIKDALKRNIDCLYFISRDGHHLKKIADAIIDIKQLSLKTKYIYGSRKAWRIPSFIDKIDDEFFGNFGNFSGVSDFKSLINALNVNSENFQKIFPELEFLKDKENIDKKTLISAITCIKCSDKYKEYLLIKANSQREVVDKYLNQEINFEEKFAFVEYWARGYTQDCLKRLLQNIFGNDIEVPFYYVRSIYQTKDNSIRYNYTTNTASLIFIEAIFANLPYKSVCEYKINNDRVDPVIVSNNNNNILHKDLEDYLVKFCYDFYNLDLKDEDLIERQLFDFSLEYYNKNQNDKYIVNSLAPLKYTETLHGNEGEFAPAITCKVILKRIFGENFKPNTNSIEMSIERSSKPLIYIYKLKKKLNGDKLKKTKKFYKKIKNKIQAK
ncbi:hypothetical protein C4R89_06430 [Clostridioides difficile]|nr:hypothetical protein [Clostridioides difficile]